MKLKRICTSLVIAILSIVLMTGLSTVLAAIASTPLYLGRIELRTNSDPNMAYSIREPGNDGHIIWNLVKYDSSTSNSYTSKNIYCINPNIGLGSDENDVANKNPNDSATYDTYYNMKTQSDTIKGLSSITDKEITLEDNTKISSYNAILALGDMLYLPGDGNSTERQKEKENLLKVVKELAKTDSNASSYVERMEIYPLTDDDINAVQQAAIWYFTNYGDTKYDRTNENENSWLFYKTEEMTSYTSLSGYNGGTQEGAVRNAQANVLYKYLIDTAKEKAKNYLSSSSSTGAPAKVNTTALNYEESNSNYIIGPINISENSVNTLPYTIDFVVKNGETEISNFKLLDSNKNEVASGTKVKDLVGRNFYISVPKDDIATLSVSITINYSDTTLTLWTKATDINATQPVMIPEKKPEQVSAILTVTPNSKPFDLALRKYITKVNGVEVANSRVPNIDESTISSTQTATYKHRKNPVTVKTGDNVTYKLTIYNEGEKDGRATKIVDQLPTGLKFSKVVSGNFELGSYSETDNILNLVRKSSNTTNLPAYTTGSLTSGSGSETIEIECEVTATANTTNSKVLTNVAWIAEEIDSDGNVITNQKGLDRDSEPSTKPIVNKDNMENYTGNGNKEDLSHATYYYKGQQDDDDFEKLVLMPQSFDLKLIKRITAVNNQNVKERIESIDVSNLNKVDSNGNFLVDTTSEKYTTAEYELNKEPVSVKKGDIVTYTFRIYNEGTIDGYASEITEDIPEGLEFLWSEKVGDELVADTTLTEEEKAAIEFNQSKYWTYADSTLTTIKTNYLDIYEGQPAPNNGTEDKREKTTKNLIKAFGANDGTKTESDLDYKEVSVMLKVVSENVTGTIIRNEACISEDTDENGDPIDDRDSDTEKWVKYEDDEDYDNIILKSFDLALRKFIIAISDDTNIENEEYLKNEDGSYTRAPEVDTSKLNTLDENGKMITTAIYNHTKEPVLVKKNDIVVYNLRVYNEGEIDGYASEIKDHLPPYLEFVDSDFNEQYGWEVSEDGRTVTTRYLENAKIKAATLIEIDGGHGDEYRLAYKEVPIMCKVKDTAKTSENITNIADITEYLDENKKPVNDRDSQEDNVNLPEDENLPGYKEDETGEYIPGQQDDDDFEKVIVKEFDLALRKWVTQAIVIDNNGQSVTETGHDAWDDPEQVVKVELHRKKLNEVTVKFRYSIRVYNQGDIAGYAKEVTDYVPEGLKFVAEDNPGWTDEGNNVISTRLLENTLLQPGEYADVEVVLTWINSQDNMGVMINTAEISEDYNEYGIPDRDSTPDNKKPGEDDIDDAPVMLSISTGQMRIYFTLGFVVLITIAGGVVLIRKFVL